MDKTNYDASKVKETIDKKEAALIGEISEKVADNVSDVIEDELRDKIDSFADSIDNVSEKASSIGDTLENLTSAMKSMQSYDFSSQFNELQSMQQAVNQAAINAKTIFDDTKKDNEKLQEDLGESLHNWNELHKIFSTSVKQAAAENERITMNISALNEQIQEFRTLQSEMSETQELLHHQFENQNNAILEQKLTELQQATDKNAKTSPVTICTLVFSIILVILEVVSFFI